jgi:hypothetical protein
MAGEVFPERVIWRRLGAARRFAGTLSSQRGRLRLAGHDPATGAEALLLLPTGELGLSRRPAGPEEWLDGAPALVLPVSGADPLLLRPAAPRDPIDLGELQRFLDDAAHQEVTREPSLRRAPAPLRRERQRAAEKAAGA